ncbi:MAG: cell division protein FtsI [Burkholderiaceae bacterium]
MPVPHLLRAGRALLLCLPATALLALGGCSVLSPMPAWELVKATGGATATALNYGPAKASNTVHHGDAPPRSGLLCIEYNRETQLDELVPALQAELREQGLESRVYEQGTGLQECRFWLRYVATIQWAVPPLASSYRAYLSSAALSLHKADGSLMASSMYAAEDELSIGRWSTTRRKIAPVVKAVITGFES